MSTNIFQAETQRARQGRASVASCGRRLLFVTQRPSDFTEMSRAARALARRNHEIFFLHHALGVMDPERDDPVVVQMRRLAQEGLIAGYELIDERTGDAAEPPVVSENGRLFRALREVPLLRRWFGPGEVNGLKTMVLIVASIFLRLRALYRRAIQKVLAHRWMHPLIVQWYYLNRALWMYRAYQSRLQTYERLLHGRRIDVVVLPEDVVGMVSPLLIKAAHRQEIGVLVLPYTIANHEEAFRSLSACDGFQLGHAQNFLIGRLFPHWRLSDGATDLVRLPGPHIVAHELLRVTPPDPWMMNSGYADVIAVENEAMYDYYVAAGIPPDRMRTVGAVYDDQLFALRRNRREGWARLRQELHLAGDKPLLLVGGCPDQLSSCPACEFTTMEEAAARLAECLAPLRDDYHLVVRPHPNFPELGDFFQRHGISVSHTDTLELIAMAELYVAFGSATIRWAIACGIPTINYDLFHYQFTDYAEIPGVIEVRDADSFRQAVSAMRPGGPMYRASHAALARIRGRWGMLDGRCLDRIEQLIQALSPDRVAWAAARAA